MGSTPTRSFMEDPVFYAISRIRPLALYEGGYTPSVLQNAHLRLVTSRQISEEDFFLAWHSAKILDTPFDFTHIRVEEAARSLRRKHRRR